MSGSLPESRHKEASADWASFFAWLESRLRHRVAGATVAQHLGLVVVPLFGAYTASFAMWRDGAGSLVTGLGYNGWGDLLFHIRGAIFFVEQGGWPRESFFLSGEPVGYAFLSDFISGLLWKAGVPLARAFNLPTVALVFVFLLGLEWLVLRMTKSISAAILSALLFTGFAGLSGWHILPELSGDWWNKLHNLPHGITAWHDAKFVILNPFITMFHQRAYLLGFPLLVVLIYLGWRSVVDRSTPALAWLTLAGILLALAHSFTWAVFVMLFPSWIAWTMLLRTRQYTIREMAMLAGSIAAIGIFGFLIVKTLQPSAGASVIKWKPGWMTPNLGWFYFWLKNLGLYAIAGPLGIYFLMGRNRPLAALGLASFTPFIAANLFQFAPWEWDNTKMFAPVWLILSITAGTLLALLWKKNLLCKALVIISIPVFVLSAVLEIARIFTYGSAPIAISTSGELALGELARARLDKRGILLTEPTPSHPVFLYSGCPSFLAFEGWLWSQGWKGKYEQRLVDKRTIYAGGDAARDVIRKNRIAYVTIGPPEVGAGANKTWFDTNYPQVLSLEGYVIYDVRGR